jgi:hypothetical protein
MKKRKSSGERDYDVGYRKPPISSRFKKGQPRPPRKAKPAEKIDLSAFVLEELAVPISFKDETGRNQRLPKAKVLAKKLVNEALKTGNPKYLKDFLPKASTLAEDDYSEADLAMIARFLGEHVGEGGGGGEDA